jgi:hypothetical protein
VCWVLDSYPDLVSFPNSMETKIRRMCLGPPICPVFSGFEISLVHEGHDGSRSPAAASV